MYIPEKVQNELKRFHRKKMYEKILPENGIPEACVDQKWNKLKIMSEFSMQVILII